MMPPKSKSTCAIVALALAAVVTSTNARNCVGNEALTPATAALLCPNYESDPHVKIKHAWFDPVTEKGGHCGGTKTEELKLSIANGLFGGNTGDDRDCTAWCVKNSEGGGHFKFDHKRECFKFRGTGMCGTKKEKKFAEDAKAQTCPTYLECDSRFSSQGGYVGLRGSMRSDNGGLGNRLGNCNAAAALLSNLMQNDSPFDASTGPETDSGFLINCQHRQDNIVIQFNGYSEGTGSPVATAGLKARSGLESLDFSTSNSIIMLKDCDAMLPHLEAFLKSSST